MTGQIGRVSDYELGGIDMKDPPGDDAQVIVKMAGFRVPDMTVRTHDAAPALAPGGRPLAPHRDGAGRADAAPGY